jgi:DNA-binding transcriptional MerR regulator
MSKGLVDDDRLLTTAEVAEHFRTTPSTVRYWHFAGTGPVSVKIGKRRLYRRSDVDAYEAAERRRQGQPAA